MTGNVRIT